MEAEGGEARSSDGSSSGAAVVNAELPGFPWQRFAGVPPGDQNEKLIRVACVANDDLACRADWLRLLDARPRWAEPPEVGASGQRSWKLLFTSGCLPEFSRPRSKSRALQRSLETC